MRRSALGVAATAAALLALAACGGNSSSSGSSPSASDTASSAPSSDMSSSAPASDMSSSSAPSSASSSSSGGAAAIDGKGAKVGFILPDRQSSNRWISSDPDAIAARCKADNLQCDVQNANGSATQMVTIAQNMLNNGVKVLSIVNLDNSSGATIEKAAKAKGVLTIDYDRLTLGGSASLYVSFDGVAVGKAQGEALVNCAQVKGKSGVKYVDVNGAPTDSNAAAFKQGYDSVLSKQKGWTKVADQSITDWNNQLAGTTFASMLTKTPTIGAVMVANDGMAGSVITQLRKQGLAGKVAVSGQDSTVQGLQAIMSGTQCFTIYKPSQDEANPAVDAAAKLANGDIPTTNTKVKDTQTGRMVPAILANPITITKSNIAMPINATYTPKKTTCVGVYAQICKNLGVK